MKLIWVKKIYLGVHEGDTILIWGYAEGYNFDLGVLEYQNVENPCYNRSKICNIDVNILAYSSTIVLGIVQSFFIFCDFYCASYRHN